MTGSGCGRIHRDAASPIFAALTEAARHARGVSCKWCAGRPTIENGRVRISHWPSCDRPRGKQGATNDDNGSP